jgi:hypothetical protein
VKCVRCGEDIGTTSVSLCHDCMADDIHDARIRADERERCARVAEREQDRFARGRQFMDECEPHYGERSEATSATRDALSGAANVSALIAAAIRAMNEGGEMLAGDEVERLARLYANANVRYALELTEEAEDRLRATRDHLLVGIESTIARIRADERERCAKVCDALVNEIHRMDINDGREECAAAIRAMNEGGSK